MPAVLHQSVDCRNGGSLTARCAGSIKWSVDSKVPSTAAFSRIGSLSCPTFSFSVEISAALLTDGPISHKPPQRSRDWRLNALYPGFSRLNFE